HLKVRRRRAERDAGEVTAVVEARPVGVEAEPIPDRLTCGEGADRVADLVVVDVPDTAGRIYHPRLRESSGSEEEIGRLLFDRLLQRVGPLDGGEAQWQRL